MTKSHLKLPLVYDFRLSTDKFFKLQGFLNFKSKDQVNFNCITNPKIKTGSQTNLQLHCNLNLNLASKLISTSDSTLILFNFDFHLNFDLVQFDFHLEFDFEVNLAVGFILTCEPKWTEVFYTSIHILEVSSNICFPNIRQSAFQFKALWLNPNQTWLDQTWTQVFFQNSLHNLESPLLKDITSFLSFKHFLS